MDHRIIAIPLSLLWLANSSAIATTDDSSASTLPNKEASFLLKHWSGTTIPLQGPAPSQYSDIERSLDPADCGQCHTKQYRDWKTTIHSQAMGPGVLGQLVEMVHSDPATTQMCWICHTPLAEQQEVLLDKDSQWVENKHFDATLQQKGLVCAACHVRNHQRFGPPRKSTPTISGRIYEKGLPHNGFTANPAFTKSAFCKGCHQFAPGDYALNGKLLENTYNEWLASDYPKKGIHCQDCHMPDRRHLWRGIHDPDMVKSGVTIDVKLPKQKLKIGDEIKATITIKNTGTGHYFPTYLTPKVFVVGQLVDQLGKPVADSYSEAIIGRDVPLDLSKELYDTRIAPGDFKSIIYAQTITKTKLKLKISVTVYPDHFYARFYKSILDNNSAGKGRALIEQAYKAASNSQFSIYEKLLPLNIVAETSTNVPYQPSPTTKAEKSTSPPANRDISVDWNDKGIAWLNYEEGLKLAKQTGKPIILLFYADWCPTCHAYKHIFYDKAVVNATASFIMIRVNSDKAPALNRQYALDGEYVPRTFALSPQGKLLKDLPKKNGRYKYYIQAGQPKKFTALMDNLLKQTRSQ